MHALNRVSQVTANSIYNQWALELARVAHAAFTYSPSPLSQTGVPKRMFWKMSIDLSHPLVDSMGHHDPLDGLMTYLQLNATAKQFPETSSELILKTEIKEMEAMCTGKQWASEDALGIGGLLSDAFKLVQLINTHHLQETARLESLLQDIVLSLQAFITHNQLNLPAEYRLAFRELGLSIGLHTIAKMQMIIEKNPDDFENADQLISTLSNLYHFHKIAELIENFWLKPKHRSVNSWQEHADINNVMLATSLLMTVPLPS